MRPSRTMMTRLLAFSCATPIFLLATTIRAADPAAVDQPGNVAIQYRLTKLVYERAHRTTFWLEIDSKRKGLSAKAVCDLREDGTGVGRFPLEQITPQENPDALGFRISCLNDDFIEDTIIHVLIRDESTGETVHGARIRLKDAKPRADNKSPADTSAIPVVDEAAKREHR